MDHQHWMQHCLNLAADAARAGEVPVAAAVVKDGELIADAFNQPIGRHDPSAHAEILALRRAAERLQNYRLPGCTLYVTVEPCAMCSGALVHARISHVVFGAEEPRAGAVVSRQQLLDAPWLNHRVSYEGGVLADQCGELLRKFFAGRRAPSESSTPDLQESNTP